VNAGAGDEAERPFPGEQQQTHDQVDDLEHRYRSDSWVEGCGEEVPENLGPEKGVNSGSDLVCIYDVSSLLVNLDVRLLSCNLQAADERTTSLAQWFLISLPMVVD